MRSGKAKPDICFIIMSILFQNHLPYYIRQNVLRILTGKKHPQVKLQRLRKV